MSVKSAQNLLGRYLSLPSTGERPMRIAPSLLREQREKGSSGDPRQDAAWQDGPIPSYPPPPPGGCRSGLAPPGRAAAISPTEEGPACRGGRPRGATTRPPPCGSGPGKVSCPCRAAPLILESIKNKDNCLVFIAPTARWILMRRTDAESAAVPIKISYFNGRVVSLVPQSP